MLKKFQVKNYRGFKDTIGIDFSNHREYSFHSDFIKNGIVNKSIMYGKNGSGKSNFGFALFDIVNNLTDKLKLEPSMSYQNGKALKEFAEFNYTFAFDNDIIEYSYTKYSQSNIASEKITLNNEVILEYQFHDQTKKFLKIKDAESLKLEKIILRPEQSFVKYVYANSFLTENNPLSKMINFVDNMLWFRSLNYNNQCAGYMDNNGNLTKMLNDKNAVKSFELFLKKIDPLLDFDLEIRKHITANEFMLFVKYSNGAVLPFASVASTGTLALWLFYCWLLEFDKLSFLFIDEFDAFYHYETAEYILAEINSRNNFQSMVTTHNTSLMSNEVMRPDCCYIIDNNQTIKAFSECTEKDLREAHNIERIYKNGGFKG